MIKSTTLLSTLILAVGFQINAQVAQVKRPLVELFTSSTCPPCQWLNEEGFDGKGLNKGMEKYHPNDPNNGQITLIKYQVNWPGNGDHAYNTDVQRRVNQYGVRSAPSPYLEGTKIGYTMFNSNDVDAAIGQPSNMGLSADFTIDGNDVTVDLEIDPDEEFGRVYAYVGLLERQYDATGHFSFSNGEDEFHHVLRKFIKFAYPIELQANVKHSEQLTYTFTRATGLPSQGSYDLHEGTDIEIVVFITDSNGDIVQSTAGMNKAMVGVEEQAQELDYRLFPNPAGNSATLQLKSEASGPVQVYVYNTLGKVMDMPFNGQLNEGVVQTLELNTAHYPNGMYVVSMVTDGEVRTHKMQVAH